LCESTDVFILDRAFARRFAHGVARKKAAMVFFEVGVVVTSWRAHEIDVVLQPSIGIIAAVGLAKIYQFCG
jgi:hypothetical protein